MRLPGHPGTCNPGLAVQDFEPSYPDYPVMGIPIKALLIIWGGATFLILQLVLDIYVLIHR